MGPPLEVVGSMLSHVGCVRDNNEDTVAYTLPRNPDPATRRGALMLVADGMGGHAGGEVASRMAAQTIHRQFYQATGPTASASVTDALANCIAIANAAILERGNEDPACAGMGSTCTVLVVRSGRAYLAHIGDSRAYILRDGALHQLSEDHTMVAELVRMGRLTASEASRRSDRNVLFKALGTRASVSPQLWSQGMKLLDGDRLVLCSDGLHDLVDATAIGDIVATHTPLEACEELIEAALRSGGHDNISVGVFLVTATGSAATAADRPTRKIDGREMAEDLP